jgi:hypothetical protein
MSVSPAFIISFDTAVAKSQKLKRNLKAILTSKSSMNISKTGALDKAPVFMALLFYQVISGHKRNINLRNTY